MVLFFSQRKDRKRKKKQFAGCFYVTGSKGDSMTKVWDHVT